MAWNNRIVERRDGSFSLHEVYYREDGKPWGMTAEPVCFACDPSEGASGIVAALRTALDDAVSRPVLIEAEAWPEPSDAPSYEVTLRDLRRDGGNGASA